MNNDENKFEKVSTLVESLVLFSKELVHAVNAYKAETIGQMNNLRYEIQNLREDVELLKNTKKKGGKSK